MDRKRPDKDSQSRYKLLTTLLTAYGLGLLAAAAIPTSAITAFKAVNPFQIGLFLAGLAIHGFALYIAPKGEDG